MVKEGENYPLTSSYFRNIAFSHIFMTTIIIKENYILTVHGLYLLRTPFYEIFSRKRGMTK